MTRPDPRAALEGLRSATIDFDAALPRFIGGFYGDPGAGKTVLIHKLAKLITPVGKRIITVDTSGGWVALRNHTGTQPDQIIRYENLSQLRALKDAMKDNVKPFHDAGTLILDEGSVIGRNVTLAAAKGREGKDGDAKLPFGAIDQQDYGIAQNHMLRFYTELREQLPDLNILINSHAKVKEVKATKVPTIRPEYPDGQLGDMMRMCQFVGYMTNHITKTPTGSVYSYKVQVKGTTDIICKSQVGGFTSVVVDPDTVLRTILSWLQGKRVEATEEIDATDNNEDDFSGFVVEDKE